MVAHPGSIYILMLASFDIVARSTDGRAEIRFKRLYLLFNRDQKSGMGFFRHMYEIVAVTNHSRRLGFTLSCRN